jgi:hypothetical protein
MASLFRGIPAYGTFRSLLAGLAVAAVTDQLAARQPSMPETGPDASVLLPHVTGYDPSPNWDHPSQADGGHAFAGDEGVVIESGDEWVVGCCGDPACTGCRGTGAGCPPTGGRSWFNADCEPAGLVQRITKSSDACWIGRVDALILWRNAPPDRPVVNDGPVVGTLLNANGMDSTAAAGPRFSLFRVNNCTGHALEATYLRAANFRSIRPLPLESLPYSLAPPGIYGNEGLTFNSGNANLGSRLQSFELNRHHCHGKFLRFLAGFRWIEWQEQFTLQGSVVGTTRDITDFYQTNCFNDLYGGQIGVDANLLALSWIRFDSVIKAGAYYNNAVQSSEYTTNDPANPGSATVAVNESPVSGAFAGELGFTGVMPLTPNLDFRFGYFGLWLSGIAQPTQQLSGQQLTPGLPIAGAINANGGVVVQGVSLGLEGRW